MPIFPGGTGLVQEGSGPGQGPLGWRTGVPCRVVGWAAAMDQLVEGGPSLRSWQSAEVEGGLAEYSLSTHSGASWAVNHAPPMGSLASWEPSVGPIEVEAIYAFYQRSGLE